MDFSIIDSEEKNCFFIDLRKGCFDEFVLSKPATLGISFDALNLSVKLFGKNRAETKQIQKQNCRQILSLFRLVTKIIKFIRRNNIAFDGTFHVPNLSGKKNNNDFMLLSLLKLKFNVFSHKLDFVLESACKFLDMENQLNHMCGNFLENKCAKQSAEGEKGRTNGCCATFCKFMEKGKPCKQNCLACKLFLCKFLQDKGYCFFTCYIPILRISLSPLEWVLIKGFLFMSQKQTKTRLILTRIASVFYLAFIAAAVVILLSPLWI